METLLVIVLPLCAGVAFLCAGMEAGIFTLSPWRIAQQMRAGQKRAARLYVYLQDMENFLWTILVGNSLGMFFAMWIVAAALIRALPARPVIFWISFFAAAFVFYALCDLLPKTLFRKFPNRLCLIMSAPFRMLHAALAPLVALVEAIAGWLLRWTGGRVYKGQVFSGRAELRLLMEDTSQALSSEERGMIRRVFDSHNITVRHITVPFARWPSVAAGEPLGEALRRFRESPHNILPVLEQGAPRRQIAGFLELKRVLFVERLDPAEPVRQHLSPPFYLDEDTRVHEALRRMQRAGQRMAVVLARDRRETGLLTLEDVLQVIFGEVRL